MTQHKHWSLGAKLALVGAPFLLLALLSTAATLWVSWQLDGGAAAVNEAGRMRMQSYRMALSIGTGETSALTEQVLEFDGSLAVLHSGDPERPLFVLEPVGQLKQAIEGIQAGEFDARVERVTSDEFGTFARVLTAWQSTCIRCTAIWNERLESLYAVTVLVAA